MKLNGSEILLECLLEQGVDTLFGYPGGAVLNIYDALYKYSDRLHHIITAHEQAACHAADGYARVSGKTGVVIATSGPGATNLVTGIATAYMDSIPLVAITGNVATALLGLDSFQEVDICGITTPVTKHNFIVKDVAKLADTVRAAFRIANEGRKGPVLIDIPKDISAAICEYERAEINPPLFHNPDDINVKIDDAVKLISLSKKPLVYAGGGVVSCNATKELSELIDKLNAPVSLSLMGQCAFDNTRPEYIGMLGMHGTKTASLALAECDLMIVLGSRFSDRVSCDAKTFSKGRKILHIDIDPAELGKNIPCAYSIQGSLEYILSELSGRLDYQNHSQWLETVYEWKEKYPLTMEGRFEDELLPSEIIRSLCRQTNGEAIITTEVGQHQMWAAQFYDFKNSRSFASSGGLGTMGYGLGAAIGAKSALPNKTVVNIAGDGSFFMNCNELSTLAKHKIPIIELVFENNVLGMVRQWQRLFYEKRFSETNINRNTNLELLARAFSIECVVIERAKEIEKKLDESIKLSKQGKPVLVICRIDKDINVLPMVPAGSSVYEPILKIEIDD